MHKLLFIGSLILCCCAVPAVWADDHEDESYILLINHYNVDPEHINAFMAGGEAWKKCYLDNGGTENWTIWRRMQGDGITFTFTKAFSNWQHFFAGEEAVNKCQSVVSEQIMPYVLSMNGGFARSIPEWTSNDAAGGLIVDVYNFRIKDYELFNTTVEAVETAIKDDGKGPHSWYYTIGGRDDAEFFVVEYYADPVAMDAKTPGVWERLDEAVGEERSKQLQNDFVNSVDEMWSYLYAQLPDLSHTAENSGTAQE